MGRPDPQTPNSPLELGAFNRQVDGDCPGADATDGFQARTPSAAGYASITR